MVPESIVNALLTGIHGDMLYGHEGQFKTKERIMQSYWWRGMDQDINDFLKKCENCQKTKKYKHETKNELTPLPQCSEPNQRVHMDLFGPLKTSESGKKYIMCITDAFSKFAELIAIPDKQAPTVAEALFTRWLCRHGLPLEIVSDQGKEFCNEVVDDILKRLKVKKTTTTPYHPQTNAQVKVVNKTIAQYLFKPNGVFVQNVKNIPQTTYGSIQTACQSEKHASQSKTTKQAKREKNNFRNETLSQSVQYLPLCVYNKGSQIKPNQRSCDPKGSI